MTQTYYVDPTVATNGDGSQGSPFKSLRECRDAINTAFTTATEDYVVNCLAGVDNQHDSSALVWTLTSGGSDRQLIIQATGSNAHNGTRGTGYRSSQAIFFSGSQSLAHVALKNIAASGIGFDGSGSSHSAEGCASFDSAAYGFYAGGGTQTFKNCIAANAATYGFQFENNTSSPVAKVLNCTIMGAAQYGIRQTAGTITVKNTYSGGNGTAPYNGTMTRTNCMHDTTDVFAGSTGSTAYSTANFTNVASGSEDGRLVAGSALIGAGVGPASDSDIPTTDFEVDTRSGSTTDVGFDLFVTLIPTALPGVGLITITGRAPITNAFQSVRIRQRLVGAGGQGVANAANIRLLVWYGDIAEGAPDVSLNGLTTDSDGSTSWSIPTGTLGYGDPIFFLAQDSISYSNYTCGRLTPTYE